MNETWRTRKLLVCTSAGTRMYVMKPRQGVGHYSLFLWLLLDRIQRMSSSLSLRGKCSRIFVEVYEFCYHKLQGIWFLPRRAVRGSACSLIQYRGCVFRFRIVNLHCGWLNCLYIFQWIIKPALNEGFLLCSAGVIEQYTSSFFILYAFIIARVF